MPAIHVFSWCNTFLMCCVGIGVGFLFLSLQVVLILHNGWWLQPVPNSTSFSLWRWQLMWADCSPTTMFLLLWDKEWPHWIPLHRGICYQRILETVQSPSVLHFNKNTTCNTEVYCVSFWCFEGSIVKGRNRSWCQSCSNRITLKYELNCATIVFIGCSCVLTRPLQNMRLTPWRSLASPG